MINRMLIVDDDKRLREGLKTLLERRGYQVITVSLGEEAIDLFRNCSQMGDRFDLVILDFTNPFGINGIETAQAIRSIDSDVKLILHTGSVMSREEQEKAKTLFDARVDKPSPIPEIEKTIHSLMESVVLKE